MRDCKVGWKAIRPDGSRGTIVSIRLTPKGNLVGVQPDNGSAITHHYQNRLRDPTLAKPVSHA